TGLRPTLRSRPRAQRAPVHLGTGNRYCRSLSVQSPAVRRDRVPGGAMRVKGNSQIGRALGGAVEWIGTVNTARSISPASIDRIASRGVTAGWNSISISG